VPPGRDSTDFGLRGSTAAISRCTTDGTFSRKWIVAWSRTPSPLGVIVVSRRLSPEKGRPPFVREMSVTTASVAFAAAGVSTEASSTSRRQARASTLLVEVVNEVAMRPPSKGLAMATSGPANDPLIAGLAGD